MFDSTAGLIGHSNITGGYQGTQAEFVRVAYAEINAFKIDDDRLTLKQVSECVTMTASAQLGYCPLVNYDEVGQRMNNVQLLPLCDIAGTGLHGCLMGEVKPGQTVAIWGAGPVGMCYIMFRWRAHVLLRSLYAAGLI